MSHLSVQHITVGYSEKEVIQDLSLEIPMGKITTIIGPNGCGKSTFLKTIGRIIKAKKGAVYLSDKNIYEIPTKELAKQLAILPQQPTAPDGLTVEELVSYGRYPYQKGIGKLSEEDKRMVEWAIEVTRLTEIKEQSIHSLSGGQRQRVWIALALAQETDMILLDEPTTYLDIAYQLEVLELLEKLNREHGCTIVMVLHDINMASRYSDYLVALKNGSVISHGTPSEVITDEILKTVYEIEADIVRDRKCGKPMCISFELLNKENMIGKR